MDNLLVSASPHIRAEESVASIMWAVVVALVPAGMLGVALYGFDALILICIAVGSAVATEFIIQKARGKKQTIGDGSAVITGLLMAYIISPGSAWYVPMA